jgi:MFS family permease
VNSGLLSLIALPGYWLSVFFIDTVGRKRLQMLGFSSMAVLFTTCCFSFPYLMAPEGGLERKYLFLLLYALTFLFSNFGPNTTSFVIPGEIFPPEVRATCHGISAASGKLGAAAGAYLFPLLLGPGGSADPTPDGIRLTMLLCGAVAALGALTTWLLTPTYDAGSLAREGTYLPLDHACLRPTVGDMLVLEEYNESVSRSASQASDAGLESLSQGKMLYGHVDSMDMISQTLPTSDSSDRNGGNGS